MLFIKKVYSPHLLPYSNQVLDFVNDPVEEIKNNHQAKLGGKILK